MIEYQIILLTLYLNYIGTVQNENIRIACIELGSPSLKDKRGDYDKLKSYRPLPEINLQLVYDSDSQTCFFRTKKIHIIKSRGFQWQFSTSNNNF
jgi:hypothetical protein